MDAVEDWLIDQGLKAQDLALLLDGFCERVVAAGIPLLRGHVSLSVVDPLVRARLHTWLRARGVSTMAVPHERSANRFETSPFAPLVGEAIPLRHWILTPGVPSGFDVIDEVAALGATDYLALLHPFPTDDFQGLRGVGVSFSSDRPGGLAEPEIARLYGLSRLLATAIYRLTLRDIAVSLLDAYVGKPASRRILHGQVRRGVGEKIEAVLLMADLVGFTPVADSSGLDLIERLDEHLDAMSAPVVKRGGSVLKFMGDAILAVFPLTEEIDRPAACRLALEAAIDAIHRNAEVNRRQAHLKPLHLDVALTYGEVFYGNVGAPSRLDFTVIGPAVNEVARIEALCGVLACNLLVSDRVAAELDSPMQSLGRHKLRGIEVEREIFTPVARIGERGAG